MIGSFLCYYCCCSIKRGEGTFEVLSFLWHFFYVIKRWRWQMQKSDKVFSVVSQVWLSIFVEWRNDLCGFSICRHSATTTKLWTLKQKTTRKIWTHSHICAILTEKNVLLCYCCYCCCCNSVGLQCVPEFLLFDIVCDGLND